MTAQTLGRLIQARHSDGVCVQECKMGAAGSRMLDAWALLPTWSPMTAIGYEIKVTRSDWLSDQKFEAYRAACHLFFVIAPKGVVRYEELPPGVGLLEPIGTGSGMRLVRRVKAVRQEPDPTALTRLMAYVLMWRRDQQHGDRLSRAERAAQWARWVEEQQPFRTIAASVSARMRSMVKEALDAKQVAETRAKQLEDAARVLADLGVQPGYDYYSTKRAVERALAAHQGETLTAIQRAQRALADVEAQIVGATAKQFGVA